jgi:hypothetical protein
VNAPGIPAAMASLRREPMACRNVSRPSGVRTISTSGAPAVAFSSGSSSWSLTVGLGTALSSTFTGVSPAPSTSSAASAAIIASSNPAFPSCAATRAAALSTRPAETGTPMTCAARSGGTFP